MFLKYGPISDFFCLFWFFSCHNSKTNRKSIDVVLGIQTRGCRLVGTKDYLAVSSFPNTMFIGCFKFPMANLLSILQLKITTPES